MSQTLTYVIGSDRRALVDNIQDFKVDFGNGNRNWVQARQFERGMRQVFVNVTNEDGTPFDLTGCNVWFEGLLPKTANGDFRVIDSDGYVPLDPSAGKFRFDMPGHAFTVAGSYRQAFFRIVKNGNSVTTLEFDLDVLADKVIDGLVPKDWIGPFEQIADQLVDDLQKHTDAADKIIADFQQKVTDLVNQLNQQGSTTSTMLTTIQERISTLEAQIKSDGLLKQADLDGKLDEFNKQIQAEIKAGIGALDSEVVIARGGHNNLSDRLNEMEDGYGQVNRAIPDSTLQEAYKAGIDRTKSKMKSTDFNIGFITDTHWEENYNASRPYAAYGRTKYYDSLNHLSNIQRLDGLVDTFICGGDNTESGSRSLDVIKKQSEIFALKASTVESDHFMLLGNHDQGSSRLINYGYEKDQLPFDDYIHQDDIKELWSINDNENGELRDGDSLYFYKDYPDKKIRLIGINTNDDPEIKTDGGYEKYLPIWLEAVRQKQLDWLANTALQNVPEDYHVVVFGHAHLDPSLDGSNPNNPERHVNFDILLNLLNAFKNGQDYSGVSSIADFNVSVNAAFSEQGPRTLVGYFCGHVHQQIVREYAGIKNYIFDNSFFEDTDDGTEKQDSWAVIAIDTANRKIKVYGFGRTTDQTYDY